ncbi:hypothetical protein SDRG_12048 [Saprolegnia diclina VS20]|uniref:Uncharacterized protein n=1 Tax=Saprolegnia diclina (strain VS20) TaxID=1156394 RepID=T0Q6G1_SAPDV|nr:hypothetical protein SDRG_12048 [Saprolegnia diclina VS20]EQC30196.1 hypothetical protein SDRG_12048 [Saprolegnia diclina VS20]|eukprot:XP_008616328.1 hypothetical protein SDRG_12048 [Saprolegnia diclina VS20]
MKLTAVFSSSPGRALLRTLRWESISAVSLYFASTFLSRFCKSSRATSAVGIASGYVLAVLLTLVTLLSVTAIDYGLDRSPTTRGPDDQSGQGHGRQTDPSATD